MTIPNAPWAELVRRWRTLDALPNVESVWIPDHLFKGWYEGWATLAGVAVTTERVRFGPLVSPITFHNPARLARAAVTLDDASGGRLELAVGSGGAGPDHERTQIENWPPRDRARRFEAFVARLVDVLGDGPRIPLTIGGQGETALRLAARYADRWNVTPGRGLSAEDARRLGRERNARLGELCAETGRTVLRSALIGYPFVGETPFRSAEAWDEFVAAWADAGFDELILVYPPETEMPEGAVEPQLFERLFGQG